MASELVALGGVQLGYVFSVKKNASAAGFVKCAQNIYKSGFSRTRSPPETNKAIALNLKIYIGKRVHNASVTYGKPSRNVIRLQNNRHM